MQPALGFNDAFKAHLLRRLGSWGSRRSADDVRKLVTWAARGLPDGVIRDRVQSFRRALDSSRAANDLVDSFFRITPLVRRRLIENLLVNWGVSGAATRYHIMETEGWMPPSFAVISPTMRCNLRCVGCYAFEYRRDGELTTAEFDDVIEQCKALGIYFFTISGGEPFVREDLLDLIGKHSDAFFQIYTNGTLIDDAVADRLLELGNAMPAISVEGYEAETDARRGAGTYARLTSAMERLRARKLLFGISFTATRRNHDIITDEAFYDHYIDRGALFAWIFQYIPIGRSPDVGLTPTPEQRTELRRFVHALHRSKQLFVGDFWNDGVYTGGCMAGGRLYFHVTSNGGVEPCVFAHFSAGSVRKTPLREILQCDFFKAIRYEQPYRANRNLYTPCMIIDNPEVLRRLVSEYGVRPSHPGAETIVTHPEIVAHLDQYSEDIKRLADPDWERDHWRNPKSEWYRGGGYRLTRQWAHERADLVEWMARREMINRGAEEHQKRPEEHQEHSEEHQEHSEEHAHL